MSRTIRSTPSSTENWYLERLKGSFEIRMAVEQIACAIETYLTDRKVVAEVLNGLDSCVRAYRKKHMIEIKISIDGPRVSALVEAREKPYNTVKNPIPDNPPVIRWDKFDLADPTSLQKIFEFVMSKQNK